MSKVFVSEYAENGITRWGLFYAKQTRCLWQQMPAASKMDGVFDGISFVRPKSKERQLMQERKEKALQLSEKLREAETKFHELEKAKEYVNSVFTARATVHHKKYGDGVIRENTGTIITIDFPDDGEKQLGTFVAAANGIITSDAEDYEDKINSYKELLKKESSIKTRLSYAEKEFAPYAEYLG